MAEIEAKPVATVALINEVSKFEPKVLNHVETTEKASLPSKEDIESEKLHVNLVTGLENFDKTKLKPTVTQEKIILPDKEAIENERKNKTESEI